MAASVSKTLIKNFRELTQALWNYCYNEALQENVPDTAVFNPFMPNVKWPNILKKSCGVNITRFWKYIWPFYNIKNERVKKGSFSLLWFSPK